MDDITLVFDLPFDGLCFFFEGMMFMKELTQTLVKEYARYKSWQIPSRCSLFRFKWLNRYDNIDQYGFQSARWTDNRTLRKFLYKVS